MGLFSIFSRKPKNILSTEEIDILNNINFNTALISEIKCQFQTKIKQLPAIDNVTGELLDRFFQGIYFETSVEPGNDVTKQLKAKYKEHGYLIFEFGGIDDKSNIAIIKGTNELDIIRYRRTDGINYDLQNEDIINKVSEWDTKYGLSVIGCSNDWLHVTFDKLPLNIDEFANEVYHFCPDIVDQGVGNVDDLKKAIEEMKGVWLWWD